MRKQIYILMILTLAIFSGCKDDDKKVASIPEVVTGEITAVTTNSFAYTGNVQSDGGANVIARGICYGTTENPTIDDEKTTDGQGLGSFAGEVDGLPTGKQYYARVYATNSAGTGYGKSVKIKLYDEKIYRGAEQPFPSKKSEVVTVSLGGKQVKARKIENKYFIQGDIVIKPNMFKGVGLDYESMRWPYNIVYYKIDPSFPKKERIAQAIRLFDKTNIRFVERTDESNYIYFKYVPDAGCYSYLGMIGGEQEIVIDNWAEAGSVGHEIAHALGLLHEQSKPDRDKYIKVIYDNIAEGFAHNFDIWPHKSLYIDGFDFNSLMCYHSWGFAIDYEKPTMTKLDGSTFNPQREHFTESDIKMINLLYPAIADIELSNNEIVLTEEETVKTEIKAGSGVYEVVSDNATSVTVDLNENVINIKGLSAGDATIIVTDLKTNKTATCQVTVNKKIIHVTGVTVEPKEKTVVEGETLQLQATVSPNDADDKAIAWKSSNTAVATVDATGKVTTIKPGTVTITATTNDGNKTATCKVTVNKKIIHVTGVTVDPKEKTVVEGETLQLKATVSPNDADDKIIAWKSSNTAVATVDATGKVTTIKAGTATITATTNDGNKTATSKITVNKKNIHVTGVTVNPKNERLVEGETLQLTATVSPDDADDKTIAWKSSNTAIATVDAAGKVTAIKAGTATITATTNDGEKTALCEVVVNSQIFSEARHELYWLRKSMVEIYEMLHWIEHDTNLTIAQKKVELAKSDERIRDLKYRLNEIWQKIDENMQLFTEDEYQELKGEIEAFFYRVNSLDAYWAKLNYELNISSGSGSVSDVEGENL